MARIAGIDIPREKRVEIALTYIYGLGLPTSQKILGQTNINPDTRVRGLSRIEMIEGLRVGMVHDLVARGVTSESAPALRFTAAPRAALRALFAEDLDVLAYAGEDHGLRKKANQLDYHHRIIEWFGHYLKDEPAASWITDGVSYLDRDRELKALKAKKPRTGT